MADITKFFEALLECAYKEKNLSDVTYAMCEADMKFRQFFLRLKGSAPSVYSLAFITLREMELPAPPPAHAAHRDGAPPWLPRNGGDAIATSCREVDVAAAFRRRMLLRRKAEAALPHNV